MRAVVVPLLLLALALAGCSDDAAKPGGAPSGERPGNATSAADGSAAATPEASPLTQTVVRIEGSTAVGACANACHYEMTDTAFNLLGPDGGLRLTGTLTWNAVSPTSQQLTLYVPTYSGGEYHWEPGYPSASGPSPLTFDLDLSGLGGVPLGLIVGNGVAAGTPAGVVAVQTPQDFLLEAVYTASA